MKEEFSKILREIEREYPSQVAFSQASGIGRTYLSQYANGKLDRVPTPSILYKLAQASKGKYSYAQLMGIFGYGGHIEEPIKELLRQERMKKVPVLGKIPAGIPIELIEDILGYEDISEDMIKGGKEYFALKVTGDSMQPKYLDGDIIIILKQEECESGQDCIVMIEGEDGTFKRVFYNDNGITLQPLNNSYMPLFFAGNEAKKVKILGVVKEIRRKV